MSNNSQSAGTLILDQKVYNLSTRSSSGLILNDNPNFKSHIRYDIPNLIVPDDSIAYIEVAVPYVVIPSSFFQINETNNKLVIIGNSLTTTYVFEYGNYNADEFITDFKTLLPVQYGITLDKVSSRFTVTNTTYSFTLSADSTCDYIMGFSDNVYSVVISGVNTAICPRVCNFLSLPRIMLRCTEFGTGQSIEGSDVLLSIPNNAKSGGQIVYQNFSNRTLVKVENITGLTIQLTDDDGNLINFQGVSSFFTLQVNIYRNWLPRPDTFYNLVKSNNSAEAQRYFELYDFERRKNIF